MALPEDLRADCRTACFHSISSSIPSAARTWEKRRSTAWRALAWQGERLEWRRRQAKGSVVKKHTRTNGPTATSCALSLSLLPFCWLCQNKGSKSFPLPVKARRQLGSPCKELIFQCGQHLPSGSPCPLTFVLFIASSSSQRCPWQQTQQSRQGLVGTDLWQGLFGGSSCLRNALRGEVCPSKNIPAYVGLKDTVPGNPEISA